MWILIGVVIYLLIGVAILLHIIRSEPWGGLVLEVWYLVVFFYPILIIRYLIAVVKGEV
jgi:hypothetical protein